MNLCSCGLPHHKLVVDSGFGCPHWHDRPTQAVIDAILRHTETDSEGKRFYYDERGTRRKLRTPENFAHLNRIIQPYRDVELKEGSAQAAERLYSLAPAAILHHASVFTYIPPEDLV